MPRRSPRRRATVAAAVLAVLVVLAAGCSSRSTSSPGSGGVASDATVTPAQALAEPTVWLCRPGTVSDPCAGDLDADAVTASGRRTLERAASDPTAPFDCFYVYPTVSRQPSLNATLDVRPVEVEAAVSQAARFSSTCQVWAPMYRQRTVRSLGDGFGHDERAHQVAYDSLLAAWRGFLAHDDDGRPIVLIGHSQGAAMLIQLLDDEIEPHPAERSRIVAALLIGGNYTVPVARRLRAATSVPLCTRRGQVGCVIAYSSFPGVPPAGSVFGRPGQGVGLMWGQRQRTGVEVACTNPADLSGGLAVTSPYFVLSPFEAGGGPTWVTYPDLYTAECEHADGATWLQIDVVQVPGDRRPLVNDAGLGPLWGYHGWDVNLLMGDLVTDVAAAEHTWAAHHTGPARPPG